MKDFKDLKLDFPLNKFEKLIIKIGWESLTDWTNYWIKKKDILEINKFWREDINQDWIWGFAVCPLRRCCKLTKVFLEQCR